MHFPEDVGMAGKDDVVRRKYNCPINQFIPLSLLSNLISIVNEMKFQFWISILDLIVDLHFGS